MNNADFQYDVFLSHNSRDKNAVEQLAARLEDRAQLAVFLDKWNLIPGEPWQESLEQALDAAATVAVFLGPSGVSSWHNEEMRVALEIRAKDPARRVVPILLPGVDPADIDVPAFLSRLTWVDFSAGLDDEAAFRNLVAGIEGRPPGRSGGETAPATTTRTAGGPASIPEPDPLPNIHGFLGRQAELEYFAGKLEQSHLAVITGMPGVGKTALGVKLAQRAAGAEKPIFWHTLRDGEDIKVLIYEIANFLAYHRPQEDGWIWKELVNKRISSLPAESIFNYIMGILPGRSYIFCFDDFQFVDRDPTLNLLLGQLRDKLPDLNIRIIVMSQRMPEFALRAENRALKGLSQAETRQLVAARGMQIPDPMIKELHERTGGNVMFLTLVLAALQQGEDPAQLIAHLGKSADIRRYLRQVMETLLSEDEKKVMRALAILLDHPGSRDALEHILDQHDLQTTLDDLLEKNLLIVKGGGFDPGYLQHSTVRDYFYSLIGRRERRKLHRRAGEFFQEEGQALEAALHFERAQEIPRAADLLSGHIWPLINQGKAHVLSLRLDQLAGQLGELSSEQQVALHQARGEVHEFVGDYPKSRAAYQAALDGVQELAGRAALLRKVGATHEAQGDLALALDYYEESLRLSRAIPDESRMAAAHYGIGKVKYRLHRPAEAQQHFVQSREIARRRGDELLLARIHMGLGLLAVGAGELEEASNSFQAARETFHQFGEKSQEARAVGNLGLVFQDMNDPTAALEQYKKAEAIFAELGDVEGQVIALSNIGQICHKISKLHQKNGAAEQKKEYMDQAIEHYERLASTAQKMGNQHWQVMALTGLAEVYHDLGQVPQGMEHARQALALAPELGAGRELGFSYFVSGLLLEASGQWDAALENYQRAIPHLEKASEVDELDKANRGVERVLAALEESGTPGPGESKTG